MLPDRLGARFVNDENAHETPVMVHHAVLGSMEHFIPILPEHREGWCQYGLRLNRSMW
ncbi:hypothetical protein [Burkholderia sp. Ac-20365]|uniref:hypothetical protein n=1 Tax=Burkholderia sp. Ac-20365 TaxID=2703897 RepID=UPI0032171A8E